jgi:hypothetical protein
MHRTGWIAHVKRDPIKAQCIAQARASGYIWDVIYKHDWELLSVYLDDPERLTDSHYEYPRQHPRPIEIKWFQSFLGPPWRGVISDRRRPTWDWWHPEAKTAEFAGLSDEAVDVIRAALFDTKHRPGGPWCCSNGVLSASWVTEGYVSVDANNNRNARIAGIPKMRAGNRAKVQVRNAVWYPADERKLWVGYVDELRRDPICTPDKVVFMPQDELNRVLSDRVGIECYQVIDGAEFI